MKSSDRVAAVACLALLAVAAAGAARAAAALDADLGRYRVILERQPFGVAAAPEADAAGAAPPPPTPPPFVQDLRLCAITETGVGLRVGIVNIRSKESYYLRPGEVQDGIELVDASFEAEGALLRRDGQESWLYMETAVAAGAAAGGDAAASVPAPGLPRIAAVRADPEAKRLSYIERLRQRREELQRRAREEAARKEAAETSKDGAKLNGEALATHLQNYQMELIRQGKTPLPIPLTPEMDAQLVAEGVLPPQE